mgnify:CR=1 FL=1
MRDPEKTIGGIIDKSTISIIGSVDQEGFPNTKAMLKPRKRVGIKEIYFSTNTSSIRVTQFKQNPKSCLYFFDRRFFRGVMLRGSMDVLTDIEIKKEIWQDGDEIYYPEGIIDTDYCVLRFTAIDGRYYSNFKSENFLIDQ